jgi:hypothetical protein
MRRGRIAGRSEVRRCDAGEQEFLFPSYSFLEPLGGEAIEVTADGVVGKVQYFSTHTPHSDTPPGWSYKNVALVALLTVLTRTSSEPPLPPPIEPTAQRARGSAASPPPSSAPP